MEQKVNEGSDNNNAQLLANGTIDNAAVDKTEGELKNLKAENKSKVYGINVKTELTKQLILDYLDTEVEWKYMEAFGIPKIYDTLQKEKVKNGNVYLPGLEVEALAFYISKATGKGRKSAGDFLLMKDAVDTAYNIRIEDNKKENLLMQRLEALKNGINISGESDDVDSNL